MSTWWFVSCALIFLLLLFTGYFVAQKTLTYCSENQPLSIVRLRSDMRRICNALSKNKHLDPDVQLLLYRFDTASICKGTSSITINKRHIRICISDKHREYYDILLFVCIHELAHVMTPEWGHGANFWENMGLLLATAKELNMLDPDQVRDRLESQSNVLHCGKQLTKEYVPPRHLYDRWL